MAFVQATVIVLVVVGVICALLVTVYQSVYSDDIRADFRELNRLLVEQRFGPQPPVDTPPWSRIIHSEEKRIVWAGQGVLLGLRQVILLEDHLGQHWRVVVAHEKAKAPVFEASLLDAARTSQEKERGV